jgi:hypothetical protein
MNARFVLIVLWCISLKLVLSQDVPAQGGAVQRRTCPGEPAGNLASVDCNFTMGRRIESFVTGSLTDQAMLGATFFSALAQIRNDPREWHRDWAGYGRRVGSRYAQNLSKGLTELAFGAAMGTDPRHVSFASDPRVKNKPATVKRRIGHALMDFLTVRRSSESGGGRPLPNIPLFAGAAASGFVGNLWYPDRLTTLQQVAARASGSLGTALGASFYTEFQPEIGRLLGGIFKRGKAKPAGGAH